MISANEAKGLYDKFGAEVENFLTSQVEQKIIDAAKSGKCGVFIYLDSVETWRTSGYDYLTPLQHAILKKLQELGYNVQVVFNGASYVPRGLADDNGNGPEYKNFGIQVSW